MRVDSWKLTFFNWSIKNKADFAGSKFQNKTFYHFSIYKVWMKLTCTSMISAQFGALSPSLVDYILPAFFESLISYLLAYCILNTKISGFMLKICTFINHFKNNAVNRRVIISRWWITGFWTFICFYFNQYILCWS